MRRLSIAPLARVRNRESESGSAVIEMAVVLPVYLLILFGFFECAIFLCTYCSATYACRHYARYASLHSTSSLSPATASQVDAMVRTEMFLSSSMNATVNVTYLNPATGATVTNTVGNMVEVSASWNQPLSIPWMTNPNVSIATRGYQIITR